jgi:hypothetical protein
VNDPLIEKTKKALARSVAAGAAKELRAESSKLEELSQSCENEGVAGLRAMTDGLHFASLSLRKRAEQLEQEAAT